ncbi:O-antigen ligase family protein [Carboxylicivirga sp. M1479]|uniref:O-antigen ligase family protein n=1 Tax=Carboxylicivirga sp. M1479 TaxID=2594476 RepID=UPI0011774D24|nr:O-antigen ligase family protein [Carboxylicivirga sp. M1479]TRX66358.1 O-antigen ligase domain-containing protein [Carboxylicivirga sp. M1479]
MFKISNLIYLYFIALAFTPFVCFVDYKTVDQGFFKLYGATLLLLATALLIRKGVNKSKFDIILLFALGIYLFNLIWDITLQQRTLERKGFVFDFFVNPYVHITAFIYVIDNFKVPESLIKILTKIFIGTIIVSVLVSALQIVYDPFFFSPDEIVAYTRMMGAMYNDFEVRRVSIYGYIDNLSVTIAYLPIVGIVNSYYYLEKRKVLFVIVIIAILVPFANNYRYAQLGYFLTLIPFVALAKSKLRASIIIGVSLLFGLGLLLLFLDAIDFNIQSYIQERLMSDSASTRLLAFEMFAKFFGRHPWFGSGMHLTDELVTAIAGRSSQIHVGYLAHLFSYGIVGSLIAFTFWLMIARRFYKTAIRTGFWGSFIAIMVFLWANVTQVYYLIFSYGILMAFLFDKFYTQKYHEGAQNKE